MKTDMVLDGNLRDGRSCGYTCDHNRRRWAMRSVGVREFRDQATSMMGAGETLIIERHGEPIGFYVPIAAKDRKAKNEGNSWVVSTFGSGADLRQEAFDLISGL